MADPVAPLFSRLHGFSEFLVFVPPAIERRQVKSHELSDLDIREAKCAKLSRQPTQLRPKPTRAIRRLAIMLQFACLEELRPPVLPPVQTSATHTKVGRYLLIADTGLTERANLFDVFLPELGRLTSASLAAEPRVLARHALRNDLLTLQTTR
jgi:hypothetical protein